MAYRGFTDSQIEAFMWTMKTASATEAAEKMLISQPAISRLLKQLEDRLGFALFERQHNRLLPTRRGTLFYHEVDKVYLGLAHLRVFADKLKDQHVSGQLRIVSMPSLAISLLPALAMELERSYPDLELALYSYRSSQIPDDMIAGRFDFAITTDMRRDPRYQSRHYALPCVCALPASHPLTQLDVIDYQDLNGEVLIYGEPHDPIRQKMQLTLDELNVHPRKVWTISLQDMAVRLVKSGTGIAVGSCLSALDANEAEIAIRPLRHPVTYEMQILLPLDKDIDPAVAAINTRLIALLEQKIELSQQQFYPR